MTGPNQDGPLPSSLGRQGFGAMRLRDDQFDDPDRDPVRVVHAAVDAGVRMIDTADLYDNEELVGRAVRSRRDEIILASKFAVVWRADPADGYDIRTDPAYVHQACEASLRRLGVDHLELYYVHHRSETVPIEDTVGALVDLIEQGKIGAIGLSNVTAEDLRRAHAVHPVLALQEQWSLVSRTVETDLVPAAAELGVTVVAHSPTGHGLLHEVDGDEHRALRTLLGEIAREHDATIGQIALAWVHHRDRAHGVPVVPLPGTTRVSHLHRNVAAVDLDLGPDALRRLDEATRPDHSAAPPE